MPGPSVVALGRYRGKGVGQVIRVSLELDVKTLVTAVGAALFLLRLTRRVKVNGGRPSTPAVYRDR